MECKENKKQWIIEYMQHNKNEFIDIVAENFVNAYINQFNPKIVEWYPYGAPKVLEIGKLLTELYKEKKINRYRYYCKNYQDGFPKWVYTYFLNNSQ